ncbi:unnamed protein product, partial [Diplocarpon coronariae]
AGVQVIGSATGSGTG